MFRKMITKLIGLLYSDAETLLPDWVRKGFPAGEKSSLRRWTSIASLVIRWRIIF